MKVAVDTNILLRVLTGDDPRQAKQARAVLEAADLVAIPIPVFCELAWTLHRLYKKSAAEIASAIEAILAVDKVVTDRSAIDAGLVLLRAGGDFADGVSAWMGMALGAETFMTFDRDCIKLLRGQGLAASAP